ncbi:hypothetical protein HAX54_042933, partial [Datura stramonium]|nr:hypothetical protein [Datura stramonium]
MRATLSSPRDKACDAALSAAMRQATRQGFQDGKKLDFLLQLGKGTSSPSQIHQGT